MSKSQDHQPNPSDGGVGHYQSWEDLPEEAQTKALADAISFLADRDRGPLAASTLSESLGSDQLAALAANISLSEEELLIVAKNISHNQALPHDQPTSGNHNQSVTEIIRHNITEHPASSFYAISVGMMMVSLYLSSPIIALAGAFVLLITVLHYAV